MIDNQADKLNKYFIDEIFVALKLLVGKNVSEGVSDDNATPPYWLIP